MEFTVGAALSRGFSIWFKNLIPFTLLSALVYLPLIGYTFAILNGYVEITTKNGEMLANGLYTVGSHVLQLISTGAIVYGVFEEMRGAHASLGSAISVGFQRLLPVLGVGILVGLCVIGGSFLLIIPGVIIFLMLYVAVPVAVVERPGVMASLKRSRELTQGSKGSIFGMLFVLGILNMGLAFAFTALLPEGPVRAYGMLALEIVLGSLGAVVSAVTYSLLRQQKEGANVEDLAAVFA